MKLIFDIIKNGKDVPVKRNYHFNMTSGSIGRADDVDWSLNDSNNYISSNHATVEYKDGIYFIKDHSTNGTFLKYPYKKLPKNISIKINSTDIFIIGDYEIQARFIDNDYSQDDIISSDYSVNNNNTINTTPATNQLIPNDDDFLDDFILEDSNVMDNSFIIPDDDEDFNSSVMNMFNSKDDIQNKDLNPFNDIETTIMDTEFVDERTISDPLNEHINIQNFQEIIEPEEVEEIQPEDIQKEITEVIIEKEEIKEEKSISKNINAEEKPILTKEETEHSISIIEKN